MFVRTCRTFLLFLALLTSQGWAAPPTLVIGSAFAHPLSTPEQTGLIDLVVHEACRRIGRDVEITPLPAERSLISANDGLTDGDLLRIDGMDSRYPRLIKVPEKSMDFEFVCFTRRQGVDIGEWGDLAPYSVAIVRGWKILEENVRAEILTAVDDIAGLMRLLANDRVDIAICERLEGLEMSRRLGLADVRVVEPPIAVRPMFLYLNERHAGVVDALADALRHMKEDGTYARLTDPGRDR